MKTTWFSTSALVILGVQSALWFYARRHGSEGELMWPSFNWSLCAAFLQSLWGSRLVRPSTTWTLARTVVRGMSIGLLVSIITATGGALVFLLLTMIVSLRETERFSLANIPLDVGFQLLMMSYSVVVLFHSIIGGAVAGAVVAARKRRALVDEPGGLLRNCRPSLQ